MYVFVIYKITNILSSVLTLEKIGSFGDKLYQHNIKALYGTTLLLITITNGQSTSMTASQILQWYKDNGLRNDGGENVYYHESYLIQSGTLNAIRTTFYSDTQLGYVLFSGTASAVILSDFSITDTVIPL